jgi:hypothetical protein
VTGPRKWTRLMGALALALAATPALAEWARLDGDGIVEALTGAQVDYDGAAWQEFLPSGRTIYRGGGGAQGSTSQGDWRVEAGNYCSRWPPGDGRGPATRSRSTGGRRALHRRLGAISARGIS